MLLRALSRSAVVCVSLQRASTRLRGANPAPRPLVPALSRCLASSSADTSGQQLHVKEDGGVLFERGIDCLDEGKLPAAVELFAQAAESGHPEGNFYLGLAYDGLLGEDARGELPVEKDAAAAARCYLRASEQGLPEAMLNLSLCYRMGEGVPRDTAAGFAWAERGAEAGCERAQYNVGIALDPEHPPWGTPGESGPNAMVPKDPERAVRLYRSAAAQGHAKAKVNLGIMMYGGVGCPEDKPAAVALWREAREEGVPQAEVCLRNAESRLDEPARHT